MRRLRIFFVAIAVLVAVPVGLLLRRALQSIELESRTRHQAVAERIFDEMERALSEMLVGEEDRPFGQYSQEYIPLGQDGGVPVRSPLADPPSLPFIVAYFQLDPDGTLHTPMGAPSETEGQGREILSELNRTVAPYFRSAASTGLARRMAPAAQAPGTTVVAGNEVELRENKEQRKLSSGASVYDALRALNKGIEQRAGRQAKTELDYAAPRDVPAVAAEAGRKDERMAALDRDDTAKAVAANAPARLEIAPMVGRVIDPRHLLLYRTVVREAQTYRQGLLLDIDALAAWLRMRVLGNNLTAYATVAFATSRGGGQAVPADAAFLYKHRFAEPFADVSAQLALRPLPGVGSANYVYALCAVVVIAGGLGLLALYRMVSVTVAYAERRSNFVAAVSHELKTPLTAIRMYGEMLRDGIVPVEAKRVEYYGHITTESERLSRLINNVLEFSRLEKGTRQMSLVTASLAPVITEGVDLMRSHAEHQGFELAVELDAALPSVRFERDAVLQILFNLVDNAVKYVHDGYGKRITVSCRVAGSEVYVAVRDQGPGVEPRHLRKLFEPFYRGESELTRRSTGSGLGLALVHSLATQMGTRTAARNLPEGGFEVEVRFPAVG